MNFCFGPMSKNVVDTIIGFSLKNPELNITFIPSRRQVEHDGGYVNNWCTKDFVEYVKTQNPSIKIERDHGGPNQGTNNDDGFESLNEDAKYMDLIHIDPWKMCSDIDEGIKWTEKMIRFCNNINPNLFYEIATEEAIHGFSVKELEYIIEKLRESLGSDLFNKIKFLVIQCGTKLSTCKNGGIFDENKLQEMIAVANKNGLVPKEHNGDWVNLNTVKRKKEIGLSYINIAPQLGEIESKIILKNIRNNQDDYEKMYNLCIESGKWKKWVTPEFDYKNEKDQIILITGHYIFSNPEFQKIKEKYTDIDSEIKEAIADFLLQIYGFYSIREKCIFCDSADFETVFEQNYKISLFSGLIDNPSNSTFEIPYNVCLCKQCNAAQNKYLGNLSIVYRENHIDNHGTTKNRKHAMFGDFIVENQNINGIIEVGACHHGLSKQILDKKQTEYNIIEPSFTGDKTNLNIIPTFIENVDLQKLNANTVIMSDVFEHFYNPKDILEKLKNSNGIEYIYLNHPDFDYSIKNNILINLNIEHTFFIEHQFLFKLFEQNGFILNRRFDFENFSLFLEFKRDNKYNVVQTTVPKTIQFENISTHLDVKFYLNKIIDNVKNINTVIEQNPNGLFYLWPCSMHSTTLITMGLDYKNLSGILDNSPNKIGRYLYGYNLLCSSFDETIKSQNENIHIFLSCSENYIKELNISNLKVKIIRI